MSSKSISRPDLRTGFLFIFSAEYIGSYVVRSTYLVYSTYVHKCLEQERRITNHSRGAAHFDRHASFISVSRCIDDSSRGT